MPKYFFYSLIAAVFGKTDAKSQHFPNSLGLMTWSVTIGFTRSPTDWLIYRQTKIVFKTIHIYIKKISKTSL